MVVDDFYFMRKAIEAGSAVEGTTGENPPVGCVIVRDGRVISQGATQPPGKSHAEAMAIAAAEEAGEVVEGAVVYVTLEPCNFQGRTPPCSSLLVSRKPARVVIGIRDPHPRVRGGGVMEIRAAGIQVTEGVLEAEISRLLAGWLQRFANPA